MSETTATFWEHLDELRSILIKLILVVLVFSLVAFALKDILFAVVLAPSRPDFVLFRWLGADSFTIHMMNTKLTEQFMVHMRVSIYASLMLVLPYVIYLLFSFISPALYSRERKYAKLVVVSAYIMFFVGTVVNYFLIFPLTVRFLGNYQVAPEVENMLTISNYVDTLMSMNILMGTVFEMPIICWLAGKMGIIRRESMRHYRRHAIVAILVVAAIITPTTDILTLLFVSLPMYLLYEMSIFLVKQ